MPWAISLELRQGPRWIWRVKVLWSVSKPPVSLQSPLAAWGLGHLGRSFHLLSWTKGQNVAILGERPHKIMLQVSVALFPLYTGHMLPPGLQRIVKLSFIFTWLWSLFQTFLDILLQTIFMTQSKCIQREMFLWSAHFHFTLHLKSNCLNTSME